MCVSVFGAAQCYCSTDVYVYAHACAAMGAWLGRGMAEGCYSYIQVYRGGVATLWRAVEINRTSRKRHCGHATVIARADGHSELTLRQAKYDGG